MHPSQTNAGSPVSRPHPREPTDARKLSSTHFASVPRHPRVARRHIDRTLICRIGGATFHAERMNPIHSVHARRRRTRTGGSFRMDGFKKNIRARTHSRRVVFDRSMVRTCALQALAALPQAIVFVFGRVVLWRNFYKVSLMESSGLSLAYNARSMSLSLADSAAAMMSVGAIESSFSASSE